MDNFATEKEIWKDIPNYEGIYQISNYGRVKSLSRTKQRLDGTHIQNVKEKIIKPNIVRGYYHVLLWKQSIVKAYQVHRLVYEVFNGKIPEGLQVNHINEIKSDNRLSNLNLMTPKENTNWGNRNKSVSIKMTNGKLSKAVLQFTLDEKFIKEFPSTMQIERELGFDQGHICACCKGKQKTAYGFKWRYKQKGES